jgi:hypothetical protein
LAQTTARLRDHTLRFKFLQLKRKVAPMKRICCLSLLFACSCAAHAQSLDADDRGAYLSAQFGDGHIDGGNAGDNRLMRWRTGELRVGRDLTFPPP